MLQDHVLFGTEFPSPPRGMVAAYAHLLISVRPKIRRILSARTGRHHTAGCFLGLVCHSKRAEWRNAGSRHAS